MTRGSLSSTGHPARSAAIRGIRALVSGLHRSARAIEVRTGITNAQLFILQQLARSGSRQRGLSIGELAVLAHTSPAAVSTIATRLARKGLLVRRSSARDARRVELALTAAGTRLLRRAPPAPTARLVGALGDLSPAKLRALTTGVAALTHAMRLDDQAPEMLFEEPPASSPTPRRAER